MTHPSATSIALAQFAIDKAAGKTVALPSLEQTDRRRVIRTSAEVFSPEVRARLLAASEVHGIKERRIALDKAIEFAKSKHPTLFT